MKKRTLMMLGYAGLLLRVGCASDDLAPNILIVFTDDQRKDAIGYANPVVHTPTLDALASRGVVFDNCFVNSSICSVSRACLMTGQYSRRHGIVDFQTVPTPRQWGGTYPELLRRAGYYTGFIGKWGIGHTEEKTVQAAPHFDFWAGAPNQTCYWHDRDCRYVTTNGSGNACTCGPNEEGFFGADERRKGFGGLSEPLHTDTDVFPIKVGQFLKGRDPGKPFCLSLFYKAPHRPFDGWDTFKLEGLYHGERFPIPASATLELAHARPAFLRSPDTMLGVDEGMMWLKKPESLQAFMRNYYRLVSGIDLSMKQVIALLEEYGVRGNTVILFTSDNGHFMGEHGFSGKWLMREPSIRVPGFIHDPRLPPVRRGQRLDSMVTTVDFTATILDLAGVERPAGMQGSSFLPLVRGKPEATDWPSEFFYEHSYTHHGRIPATLGVRTEEYKYTRYPGQDSCYEELFNLSTDPGEEENLAGSEECRDVLRMLREKTDRYIEELQ